ncbi:MAG: hypothetical protein LBL18_03975 [Bacteroidales bacterium]|nr:hypothetical protein [Bacteroidales bacterium]
MEAQILLILAGVSSAHAGGNNDGFGKIPQRGGAGRKKNCVNSVGCWMSPAKGQTLDDTGIMPTKIEESKICEKQLSM